MSKGFTTLCRDGNAAHSTNTRFSMNSILFSVRFEPQGNKYDRAETERRAELESFFHLSKHHQKANIKENKHYDDPCINFLPSKVSIS